MYRHSFQPHPQTDRVFGWLAAFAAGNGGAARCGGIPFTASPPW